MVPGRRYGGENSPAFVRLVFKDTSGSTNAVTFYAGDVPYEVSETTSGLSLDAASIAALASAIATALGTGTARTPSWARLTGASATYTSKQAIKVIVLSGTVSVAGTALPAGMVEIEFAAKGADTINSLAVDATAGDALVILLT